VLDLEMNFEDISISSIEKKDLPQIQILIKNEEPFIYVKDSLEDLYERYLESYISECEFFLKISKQDILIGVLKGRLEFKNPNESWIWFFYLNAEYRNTGLDSKIIQQVTKYFYEEYGIELFFTRIIKNSEENINFWKKINFEIIRAVKDFYSVNGKYVDMLIMKKK
jgi:ribosomal protein S18 acetylase RimI-like enzyme